MTGVLSSARRFACPPGRPSPDNRALGPTVAARQPECRGDRSMPLWTDGIPEDAIIDMVDATARDPFG